MAQRKWSDAERKVIIENVDRNPSEIYNAGLLPSRTLGQISSRVYHQRQMNGVKPKKLTGCHITTVDLRNIKDLIMRQGVTIDECAEKYDTTPRKICQLMGWE